MLVYVSDFISYTALSLTGSASRTDLSQLANGIWEIHAGCPSFLRVSSVAKIGYIPQFKASNARDQDEVSSDPARMPTWCSSLPVEIEWDMLGILRDPSVQIS